MSSLNLILKAQAATYLNTSIVVLTDEEYTQYLKQLLDTNYPRFKDWTDVYNNYRIHRKPLRKSVLEILKRDGASDQFLNSDLGVAYVTALLPKTPTDILFGTFWTFKYIYDQITRNPAQRPRILDVYGLDFYDWWLGTPTGPNSCSRDVGDLRSALRSLYPDWDIGKGDEWGVDLEAALYLHQQSLQPYVQLPTGYGDLETLRRMRMIV